jgi:hypothetical protein
MAYLYVEVTIAKETRQSTIMKEAALSPSLPQGLEMTGLPFPSSDLLTWCLNSRRYIKGIVIR